MAFDDFLSAFLQTYGAFSQNRRQQEQTALQKAMAQQQMQQEQARLGIAQQQLSMDQAMQPYKVEQMKAQTAKIAGEGEVTPQDLQREASRALSEYNTGYVNLLDHYSQQYQSEPQVAAIKARVDMEPMRKVLLSMAQYLPAGAIPPGPQMMTPEKQTEEAQGRVQGAADVIGYTFGPGLQALSAPTGQETATPGTTTAAQPTAPAKAPAGPLTQPWQPPAAPMPAGTAPNPFQQPWMKPVGGDPQTLVNNISSLGNDMLSKATVANSVSQAQGPERDLTASMTVKPEQDVAAATDAFLKLSAPRLDPSSPYYGVAGLTPDNLVTDNYRRDIAKYQLDVAEAARKADAAILDAQVKRGLIDFRAQTHQYQMQLLAQRANEQKYRMWMDAHKDRLERIRLGMEGQRLTLEGRRVAAAEASVFNSQREKVFSWADKESASATEMAIKQQKYVDGLDAEIAKAQAWASNKLTPLDPAGSRTAQAQANLMLPILQSKRELAIQDLNYYGSRAQEMAKVKDLLAGTRKTGPSGIPMGPNLGIGVNRGPAKAPGAPQGIKRSAAAAVAQLNRAIPGVAMAPPAAGMSAAATAKANAALNATLKRFGMGGKVK